MPGKWPDQTLEHRLGRPGMPFFESGLSASSEQDYHSRQFGFIGEIPAQVGRDWPPILVGSVRQPVSKGWAEETDNDLASRRDSRRDRDRREHNP